MPADAQRQARSPGATLQVKDRDTISGTHRATPVCFTERGWDQADAYTRILDDLDRELTSRVGAPDCSNSRTCSPRSPTRSATAPERPGPQ